MDLIEAAERESQIVYDAIVRTRPPLHLQDDHLNMSYLSPSISNIDWHFVLSRGMAHILMRVEDEPVFTEDELLNPFHWKQVLKSAVRTMRHNCPPRQMCVAETQFPAVVVRNSINETSAFEVCKISAAATTSWNLTAAQICELAYST